MFISGSLKGISVSPPLPTGGLQSQLSKLSLSGLSPQTNLALPSSVKSQVMVSPLGTYP